MQRGTEREGGDHNDFVILRYFLALLRGDPGEMQRQVAQATRRKGLEDRMTHVEALTAARAGQLSEARRLSHIAADLARDGGRRERAGMFHAAAAVWEALHGNPAAARQRAADALELSNGRDVQYAAAFALARAGASARAGELAGDLERRFPEDTSVRFTYLPVLRAQLALNAGDASIALGILEQARRFDLALPGVAFNGFFGAMYPAYLRGEGYLASNRPADAVREFERIIAQRGLVLADPIDAMARLQLARALARQGDASRAKGAYQDLLDIWERGDRDNVFIERASTERAKL